MILTLIAYALRPGRLVKHGEDRAALETFSDELVRLDRDPGPSASG